MSDEPTRLLFSVAPNLSAKEVTMGTPWDFNPDQASLAHARSFAKEKRRNWLMNPKTPWQIYSPVIGQIPSQRVSGTNQARAVHGVAVDYDAPTDAETAAKLVGAQLPDNMCPTYFETSLGLKARLVWVFERPVLVTGNDHAKALFEGFFKVVGAEHLLAGFDAHSSCPTEMWTNGGVWSDIYAKPLSWDKVSGILAKVSMKTSLYGHEEIPLPVIAARAAEQFNNRWQGEFKLDAMGVRFWDPTADNPTGCQVKPDGMLCFTGTQPFRTWNEIFGKDWCDQQRIQVLGNGAKGIYFDGRNYWQQTGPWSTRSRQDIVLELTSRGLVDKVPKGGSISDVGKVLHHIQTQQRVEGAAPLINRRPGLVDLNGRTILNTSDLKLITPATDADCTGIPEQDFPQIWEILSGFFDHPQMRPLDHLLTWWQRGVNAVYNYQRVFSQALFFCGPRQTGKTLILNRMIAPTMGNRMSNPYDWMVGETQFNDDIFMATVLAINDEEAPKNLSARRKFLHKLKSLVVNSSFMYHPKFCPRTNIEWNARLVVTLNDDPVSVGMLPDKTPGTEDKMMFFKIRPRVGDWGPSHILEAKIAAELPKFIRWLMKVYTPPADILTNDRFGMKPFYDPEVTSINRAQAFEQNLLEILQIWGETDYWFDHPERGAWEGNPTGLISTLSGYPTIKDLMNAWTPHSIYDSLTAMVEDGNPGIIKLGSGRKFRILREATEA